MCPQILKLTRDLSNHADEATPFASSTEGSEAEASVAVGGGIEQQSKLEIARRLLAQCETRVVAYPQEIFMNLSPTERLRLTDAWGGRYEL